MSTTKNPQKRTYDELQAWCRQLESDNGALRKKTKPTKLKKAAKHLIQQVVRNTHLVCRNKSDTLRQRYTEKERAVLSMNAQKMADYTRALHAPSTFEYEEAPNHWVAITNASITSVIANLFNGTSNRVQYQTATNSYKAERCPLTNEFRQENTSHPAHKVRRLRKSPQPAPPVKQPLPTPWQIELLLQSNSFALSNIVDCTRALKEYSVVRPVETVVGSESIADLATLFSSFSQGFQYDKNKCELWSRPALLHTWLTRASVGGYSNVSLVMHGSGHYDDIRSNPLGFEMNKSRPTNMKGFGIYVALTDYAPTQYNKGLPRGSGILCLLLRPDEAGGCLEQYEWGILQNRTVPDAINVRDPTCLLPLGLAVAKEDDEEEEDYDEM